MPSGAANVTPASAIVSIPSIGPLPQENAVRPLVVDVPPPEPDALIEPDDVAVTWHLAAGPAGGSDERGAGWGDRAGWGAGALETLTVQPALSRAAKTTAATRRGEVRIFTPRIVPSMIGSANSSRSSRPREGQPAELVRHERGELQEGVRRGP